MRARVPLATSGACPRRAMLDRLVATGEQPDAPTGLVPVERMLHRRTEPRDRVPTGVKPVEDNGNRGSPFLARQSIYHWHEASGEKRNSTNGLKASGFTRSPRSRRGAVLIAALVCLAILGVMAGTLLRWALMEHNLLRSREQTSQARWLAEAGVERAAAKLAERPEYTGETWVVPAADLPGGEPARVHLRVASIEEGGRSIEVEVEYPSNAPVRAHKQIVYQAGVKP